MSPTFPHDIVASHSGDNDGLTCNARSVLDFNPINTIASHMSYWSDVDVSHFILSQLLSHQSKEKATVQP